MNNILITGGSSGIGKSLVEECLKKNYRVFFTYLNNEKNTKSILKKFKKNCFAIKTDLSSDYDVENLFLKIKKKTSRLNCIVNNASQSFKKSKFQNLSIKEVKKIFDVNVIGTYRVCKKALPFLKKNSLIVNITSTAAKFGGNNLTHYAPTKAAIENLTIGLSRDLSEKKIRVVNVSPGIIDTENMRKTNEFNSIKELNKLSQTIPSKRLGTAKEVAKIIIWLQKKEAEYINGTTITVNGGR